MTKSLSITPHILLVEAPFYQDISDALAEGAIEALEKESCTYDRVSVAGALEIPAAVAFAVKAMEKPLKSTTFYHGFVALGCVIRGETSHYDHVATESIHGLQSLALDHALAIGNGILTTENREQAMTRAATNKGNKGGFAVRACLDMIHLRQQFGLLKS